MKTAKEKAIKSLEKRYEIAPRHMYVVDKIIDNVIKDTNKLWQKRFEWLKEEINPISTKKELEKEGLYKLTEIIYKELLIKVNEAQNKEFEDAI